MDRPLSLDDAGPLFRQIGGPTVPAAFTFNMTMINATYEQLQNPVDDVRIMLSNGRASNYSPTAFNNDATGIFTGGAELVSRRRMLSGYISTLLQPAGSDQRLLTLDFAAAPDQVSSTPGTRPATEIPIPVLGLLLRITPNSGARTFATLTLQTDSYTSPTVEAASGGLLVATVTWESRHGTSLNQKATFDLFTGNGTLPATCLLLPGSEVTNPSAGSTSGDRRYNPAAWYPTFPLPTTPPGFGPRALTVGLQYYPASTAVEPNPLSVSASLVLLADIDPLVERSSKDASEPDCTEPIDPCSTPANVASGRLGATVASKL